MPEKTLILVIGCHRSGTSAVAGCLSAMGVNFGDNLTPAALKCLQESLRGRAEIVAYDNSSGFFEDQCVVAMHDRLLASMGASWDRPPECRWPIPTRIHKDAISWITETLRRLPEGISGIKDPRATLFIPLWREACGQEGVKLCVLLVERHEEEVIASLMRREGWGRERAEELVEEYTPTPVDTSIYFPDNMLDEDSWLHVFDAFDVGIKPDMTAVQSFFTDALVHHRCRDDVLEDQPPWTVIVPSKSDEKILDFVANLLEAEPTILPDQIVVVSDGLSDETRQELADVTWVEGKKPFVYPRAINMGAEAAHPDSDLVIVGDDIRFTSDTPIGTMCCESHGAAAVAPAVVGICGQVAQRAGRSFDFGVEADWVTFNCVYIPRRVWDAVGPLDERFIGYGYDDVDWCLRAKDHGPMRIDHSIQVLHLEESSYRTRSDWKIKYRENEIRFQDKWKEALAPA